MKINPTVRAELAQAVHDWRSARQIPVEIAAARMAVTEAWAEYQATIERPHTAAEWDAAYAKAHAAERAHRDWFTRWQALGGTSNIRSIADAEAVTFPTMRRVLVQV